MKSIQKILLTIMFLVGLGYGFTGCVAGYVRADSGRYYGGDRWYHDGPWMEGPRGYVGVGISVHPVRR